MLVYYSIANLENRANLIANSMKLSGDYCQSREEHLRCSMLTASLPLTEKDTGSTEDTGTKTR